MIMADKPTEIAKSKKLIRSLLLSSKHGLPLHALSKDYKHETGQDIPYEKFGYSSVLDFLKTLPDVCEIKYLGLQTLLYAVADPTTQHIDRLVRGQKSSGRSRPSTCSRTVRPGKTSSFMKQSSSNYNPPCFSRSLEYLQKRIKEDLLLAYPQGLIDASIPISFHRRFGYELDYREYGFPSLRQFLLSIDGVTLQDFDNGGYKISLKEPERVFIRNQSTRTNNSQQNARPNSAAHEINRWLQVNIPSSRSFETCPVSTDASTEETPNSEQTPTHACSDDEDTNSNSTKVKLATPISAEGIDDELRESMKKLLQKHRNGITAAHLPQEYKIFTGRDLFHNERGYNSVAGLMTAMSDIAFVHRPDKRGDWTIYHIAMKDCIEKLEKEAKRGATKQEQRKEALKELIGGVLSGYKSGVLLTNLSDIFQAETGECLDPTAAGFTSLDDMLVAFNGSVLHMQYCGNGCVLLYSDPNFRTSIKSLNSDVDITKPRKFDNTPKQLPADAVGAKTYYKKCEVPKTGWENRFKCKVSYVENPSDIYFFQLENGKLLDNLMDEIQRVYYGTTSDNYTMPNNLFVKGQACVAKFPEGEEWHRVTIVAVPDLNFVEVFYVDYGGTACVPRSCCRMINSTSTDINHIKSRILPTAIKAKPDPILNYRMCFMDIPMLAIRAKLTGITPANGRRWTYACKAALLDLVRDKPLYGMIEEITDCGVVSMYLCDTHSEEDMYIHEVLIKDGHAVKAMPDEVKDMNPVEFLDYFIHNNQSSLNKMAPGDLEAANAYMAQLAATYGDVTQYSAYMDISSNRSNEDILQQQINAELELDKPRQVKLIQLSEENSIHLINYNDKPYVTSADISSLLWQTDCLRSKLRLKKLAIARVTLPKEKNLELFQELQWNEVRGICDGESPDNVKSCISIFELNCLPLILETFSHPSEEVKSRVLEELSLFDPDDIYWKGSQAKTKEEVDQIENENEATHMSFELGRDELLLRIQALQFRRSRILSTLTCETNMPDVYRDAVDELKEVEMHIATAQKLINELDKQHQAGWPGLKASEFDPTERLQANHAKKGMPSVVVTSEPVYDKAQFAADALSTKIAENNLPVLPSDSWPVNQASSASSLSASRVSSYVSARSTALLSPCSSPVHDVTAAAPTGPQGEQTTLWQTWTTIAKSPSNPAGDTVISDVNMTETAVDETTKDIVLNTGDEHAFAAMLDKLHVQAFDEASVSNICQISVDTVPTTEETPVYSGTYSQSENEMFSELESAIWSTGENIDHHEPEGMLLSLEEEYENTCKNYMRSCANLEANLLGMGQDENRKQPEQILSCASLEAAIMGIDKEQICRHEKDQSNDDAVMEFLRRLQKHEDRLQLKPLREFKSREETFNSASASTSVAFSNSSASVTSEKTESTVDPLQDFVKRLENRNVNVGSDRLTADAPVIQKDVSLSPNIEAQPFVPEPSKMINDQGKTSNVDQSSSKKILVEKDSIGKEDKDSGIKDLLKKIEGSTDSDAMNVEDLQALVAFLGKKGIHVAERKSPSVEPLQKEIAAPNSSNAGLNTTKIGLVSPFKTSDSDPVVQMSSNTEATPGVATTWLPSSANSAQLQPNLQSQTNLPVAQANPPQAQAFLQATYIPPQALFYQPQYMQTYSVSSYPGQVPQSHYNAAPITRSVPVAYQQQSAMMYPPHMFPQLPQGINNQRPSSQQWHAVAQSYQPLPFTQQSETNERLPQPTQYTYDVTKFN